VPELGIMFRLNDRKADPAAQYRAGQDLIAKAERIGIGSAWITSHHFGSDKGSIASPLLYLAAAAQHTRRIRLGTAVIVLTLEDPIRVAEDAALADHLSDGRIELGLGTGLEDWAFAAFGVDWNERHAIFERKLSLLRHALSGGSLADDKFLHPPGRGLANRIWRIASRIEDVRHIADAGDHLVLGGSKQLTLAENRARQSLAISEFRARAAPRQKIAVSRAFFVHEDHEEARRIFEAATPESFRQRQAGKPQLGDESAAVVGDPDFVRAAVLNDPQLALVDLVYAQVMPARLPVSRWAASLGLLQREVFARLPETLPAPRLKLG
jgi:alkanesulfonate monooxygenase SsuD/methylene tetrahydromethanopterin reductase-like flavin-dependent oxidoreductase (luciferase family)